MSINLIGINGYIGSGKDTVGNMILSHTCKMRKSSTNSNTEMHCGWEIKKFAEKLKQVASLLTGIPRHKFEDQEFKKTNLSKEWNEIYGIPFSGGDFDIEPMTIRTFLQKLGTEAIRDGLHTNAWVNALFADYKAQYKTTPLLNRSDIWNEKSDREVEVEAIYPNWIITDTRFPNEAQAIKDRGGIVIRINRSYSNIPIPIKNEEGNGATRQMFEDARPKHPSETSLDNWPFDHIIDNNGTINDLEIKVKEFLDKFQIK